MAEDAGDADVDEWAESRSWWALDPEVTFLNHGSYGACPRPVLAEQARLRDLMESEPVDFMVRRLEGLLAEAVADVAGFLGADVDGLAFVTNTTTAANTVLRHIDLQPGDKVVVADQTYGAVGNAARQACEEVGGELVVVSLPLPLPSDDEIVAGYVEAIGPQTQLVVVDAVASPSGAILPAERIAAECRARNVPCFIDAAHAPGLIPVDVSSTAATYWAANLHKWVCAPKGSAVLWADPDARRSLRPLVTSHAYLTEWHDRFGWTGTYDPTAFLAAPSAMRLLGRLGWERIQERNAELAERGRAIVAEAVGGERLVDEARAAAMTVVPLPPGTTTDRVELIALQERFFRATRIEVPFIGWGGRAMLRLSAQLYNEESDYRRLAEALPGFLEGERS